MNGETHKVKNAEARVAANSALITASEAKTAVNKAANAVNDKISKNGGEEATNDKFDVYVSVGSDEFFE